MLINSNRGLCGAFNSNIIKEANRLVNEVYASKEVSFITIGKKVNDAFGNHSMLLQTIVEYMMIYPLKMLQTLQRS